MNIPLRNKVGETVATVLIDDEDAGLSKWRWSLSGSGYARRGSRGLGRVFKQIVMHRLIVSAPDGMDVDHINGNKLDNRKQNLRVVTRSQNLTNRRGPMPNSASGIRGVSFDKFRNKWVGSLKLNRKIVFRRRFDSKDEAAKAVVEQRRNFGFLEGACQ